MKYALIALSFLILPTIALAQGTGFVPLTNIPRLTEVGNAFSLDNFLNNLYRICIGAAAVIAVLQIMRAGIIYMGGDSVTEKKEAKNLIALSIGGLILVLSPVVVFSIVNPDILSLKIDPSGLKTEMRDTTPTVAIPAATAEECRDKGGTVHGEAPNIVCTVRADSPSAGAGASCSNFKSIQVAPAGARCEMAVSESYSKIDAKCCAGMAAGNQCCGLRDEGDTSTPTPNSSTRWGWRGAFQNANDQRSTQQQGPFDTQAACNASLTSWPQQQGLSSLGEFTCDCAKPLSEQPNCSGF